MAHRYPWVPTALALPPERVEVFLRDRHHNEGYSTRQVINGRWCYVSHNANGIPSPAAMPENFEWRFPDDYEPGQALDSSDAGTAAAAHDGRDDRSASGNSFTL